jgi:glycosyltransferase involved in cell wall biosynthesis
LPVDASQVSAVLVTRGNVDMVPILDSLIFDDVVVWNNSAEDEDAMTYGRVLGISRAKNRIIYSQDDDIIHPPENQRRLLEEYEPGVLTGCMWADWSAGAKKQGIPNGYDDLVFAGSGSIYDRDIPAVAVATYLTFYPRDEFFLLWADTLIGVLAPNRQIDMRFIERPEGDEHYRMAWLPDGVALKAEAIRRAREIRDRVAVAV